MWFKTLAKRAYRNLPLPLATKLARGQPDVAFYIADRSSRLVIDDYLGAFRVHIETRSDIERRMLSRSYDLETLALIRKFVEPGQTCLDVGANVGAITLALAQQVGSEGRVEAFEPGPPFFERLRRNIEANPEVAGRVGLHQLGLSDEPGELLWQESARDPGTGSIHWADPNRPGGATIPITTLDAHLAAHPIGPVHFLKIDVDGMDHLILAGAVETLARDHPILFFETTLCDDEQREAARTTEQLLLGLGYELYKVLDKRGTIRRTRFPDLSFNTLALPAGRADAGH